MASLFTDMKKKMKSGLKDVLCTVKK